MVVRLLARQEVALFNQHWAELVLDFNRDEKGGKARYLS